MVRPLHTKTMSQTCLSKATVTQLLRLPNPPSKSICYGNTLVGVLAESPPANLVLPAGLNCNDDQLPKLDKLQSKAPQMITLRFKTTVTLLRSSILTTAKQIREAKIVTISNKPLQGCLGDTVELSDVAHPMQVYHSPSLKPTAPIMKGVKDAVVLPIDALAYLPSTSTKSDVLEAVAESFTRVAQAILGVSPSGKTRVSHYRVLGAELAVTLVTPSAESENDKEAVARRQALHRLLCLPMDRPFFRKFNEGYGVNVDNFDGGCPGRLTDVHFGIKGHGMGEDGVSEHVLDGKYLYCHYMQDRFNDSGWGCAYRSLQTILSWCALQNYTKFKDGVLPKHKEIQETLVAVGDKPQKFIGSKEWIGANEVCYALEKLTGISSKILHISRGSEMESKGRELARHFDEQGTPVMVGGGVLAWTILGVARNNRTGRTKFLILDPHYEGKDDIKTIQSKGWIGWKGVDIFKPTAFYNLCMPLRPSGV